MPDPRPTKFKMQLSIEAAADITPPQLQKVLEDQKHLLEQQAAAFLTVEMEERMLRELERVYRGGMSAQYAQAALEAVKRVLAENQLTIAPVRGQLLERPAEPSCESTDEHRIGGLRRGLEG